MPNFFRSFKDLATLGIPVYVTRQNARHEVGTWTINALLGLAIVLALTINLLLWSCIGIYEAVRVIV